MTEHLSQHDLVKKLRRMLEHGKNECAKAEHLYNLRLTHLTFVNEQQSQEIANLSQRIVDLEREVLKYTEEEFELEPNCLKKRRFREPSPYCKESVE